MYVCRAPLGGAGSTRPDRCCRSACRESQGHNQKGRMVALWSEWPVKQDEQVSVHVDHICDFTGQNQLFATEISCGVMILLRKNVTLASI